MSLDPWSSSFECDTKDDRIGSNINQTFDLFLDRQFPFRQFMAESVGCASQNFFIR